MHHSHFSFRFDLVQLQSSSLGSAGEVQYPWYTVGEAFTAFKENVGLSLLRGQDKNTYINNTALAAALNNNYVSFTDGSDLANLTTKDIKILKTVKDWNSSKLLI